MVTREQLSDIADLIIRIDGSQPLSARSVADLSAVCDQAEDHGGHNSVIVRVSGAPGEPPPSDVTSVLVSRWEHALRRLERLPAATIAVASDDCGGLALDALLATDYRIAASSLRLVVPVAAQSTWPGMALYRLAQQAGTAAVRRAVLFGAPIAAGDALAMHLVDELTSDAASALASAVGLLGTRPGTELAIRRQLMLEAPTVSFEEALGVHLAACDRTLRQGPAQAG